MYEGESIKKRGREQSVKRAEKRATCETFFVRNVAERQKVSSAGSPLYVLRPFRTSLLKVFSSQCCTVLQVCGLDDKCVRYAKNIETGGARGRAKVRYASTVLSP